MTAIFEDDNHLDFDDVALMSILSNKDIMYKKFMKMSKAEIARTLSNYAYMINNDKSTGTTLEAGISKYIGGKRRNKMKKHGCDSKRKGLTIEIKPENIAFPKEVDGKYYPVRCQKLNMVGRYNDFTWHGLIRYINGKVTNSNELGYYDEICQFIDKYYDDEDYKVFIKVACSFNREQKKLKQKSWWKIVASAMKRPPKAPTELKARWNRIVAKVRKYGGTIKPKRWNKYHISGGSVNGKIVYIARVPFSVVYEKLFDKLMDHFPPEKRFVTNKPRCSILFSYNCISEEMKRYVRWLYLAEEINKYKPCFCGNLWQEVDRQQKRLQQKAEGKSLMLPASLK